MRISDPRLRATQAAGAPTRTAAAATAAAATATALATGAGAATGTPTATEPPPSTAPVTLTPTQTPLTPAPATATDIPPASPTAPPTITDGPSPTPTGTAPPSQTPTPSPTPAFLPRDPAASLRPLGAEAGADGASSIEWDAARERYRLIHSAADGNTTLELDLRHPDVRAGRLAVRHVETGLYVAAGAGLFYRQSDGRLVEPRFFEPTWPVTAIEHRRSDAGDAIVLTVYETLEGITHAKVYTLSIVGRSLRVHAQSLDGPGPAVGRYAGFTLGDVEGLASAAAVRVPFMDSVPVTMVDERVFVSPLLDLPKSHGNELARRGPEAVPGSFTNDVAVLYAGDSIGRVRAVDEIAWLTISPRVEDTFVVPPGPPSPWRAALAGRVHVLLGRPPHDASTFGEDAARMARLAALGVVDVVAHRAAWLSPASLPPSHLPVDEARGGDVGLSALAEAAPMLSLSTAYTLTVPGCAGAPNPAYRDGDRITGSDGAPKRIDPVLACPDGAPSAPKYLMAPDAGLAAAHADLTALKALGVDALMLGEIPAWNPGWPWPGALDGPLDLAVLPRHPATIGEAIDAITAGLDRLQRVGPAFAAGAYGPPEWRYDTFLGGAIDGALRSPSTTGFDPDEAGNDAPVMPDYVLRSVRPLTAHIGAGPYARFFGSSAVWPLGEAQLDAYAATTLAYAHAGMWEAGAVSDADAVKLYHTMRPVQRLAFAATSVDVGYLAADGIERDLSRALFDGLDLAGPRLRLRYSGETALEMWINHGLSVWPVQWRGQTWLVPPDGWLIDAGAVQGYSALVEGRRVDFLRTPEYTLMDGRGEMTTFERHSARDLVIRFADGRSIEERPDGRVEVVLP